MVSTSIAIQERLTRMNDSGERERGVRGWRGEKSSQEQDAGVRTAAVELGPTNNLGPAWLEILALIMIRGS